MLLSDITDGEDVCDIPAAGQLEIRLRTDGRQKFLHQTKQFCCGSAFLLHDSGVLTPLKLHNFKNRFQSEIF